MRLEYDPQSRDFIRLAGGQAPKRWHLEDLSPKLALEILQSLVRTPREGEPSRPSPAPRQRTEQQLLEDFAASGGHITISTFNPVPRAKRAGPQGASRIKEPSTKALPNLEDLLGQLSKEDLKALLTTLSA